LTNLVPVGPGRSDDNKSLWPQPRESTGPEWHAEHQYELEAKLRAMICMGEISPPEAQTAVADDWTEAWRRYAGCR
jgi:hypothetical protein